MAGPTQQSARRTTEKASPRTPQLKKHLAPDPSTRFKLTPNKKARQDRARGIAKPDRGPPIRRAAARPAARIRKTTDRLQTTLRSSSKPSGIAKSAHRATWPRADRFKLTPNKFAKAVEEAVQRPVRPVMQEDPMVKEETVVKQEGVVKQESTQEPVTKQERAIKQNPVVKQEIVVKEEPVIKQEPIADEPFIKQEPMDE